MKYVFIMLKEKDDFLILINRVNNWTKLLFDN